MPKAKWLWDAGMDRFLIQHYDPTVRGRSKSIVAKLGVPTWAVKRRAAALGLSRPKDRPWTQEEEEYLERNYHRISIKALARRLARSMTAVRLKAKRLRLRKNGEGYTACSLAVALGVDPHWVLCRIRAGKLCATHRNTERTPDQGGDSWLITEAAVVAFIRSCPYELDLRKVDQLWFMDLLTSWLRVPRATVTPSTSRSAKTHAAQVGGAIPQQMEVAS